VIVIDVCGRLAVRVGGEDIAAKLPGRQGRLVVAYLALNRDRPVARGELLGLLWPSSPPSAPEDVLTALLSKVRRVVGPELLTGRRELSLHADTVDLEAAEHSLGDAEEAVGRHDWGTAWRAGHGALEIAARGFLTGEEAAWAQDRRREVEELRLRALEAVAAAGLGLGGSGIGAAERMARALVEASPFRETGHRLLMEALAARGEPADALRVYDALRVLLREELGVAPGPAIQTLHLRLLEAPAAKDVPRSERKLVTVLDATLAAGDDVRVELEAFGASVERCDGHGVLAVFGAPIAHEDDAARAVRAAGVLLARDPGATVRLASGDASVTDGRADVSAIAMPDAIPGRVAADELTRQLGWHAPAARAVPLVGRRHELQTLQSLRDAAFAERQPRLVTLVGEAGVGKTRLVDEFVRATGAAPAVLRGRCLAYGEGITYWALRELLWEAAGIRIDDSAEVAGDRLRALAGRVGEHAAATAHALAIVAGIPLPGNPLDQTAPDVVRRESELAWPRLASALAAERPLVLVIEDLHWAEPPLLDIVEIVALRASGPVLIVATARPELVELAPSFSHRRGMSQLSLEPLGADETHALLAALLPAAAPATQAAIATRSGGNPFFAEEIVAHLRDRGDADRLPPTVRAVLAARVDALPDREKRTLQDASVVGRAFWATALDAMSGSRDPEALRSLEERGLLVTRPSSSLPGETELWFRHALTREMAYRSIPPERRHAAHAEIGRWLETLVADRREEFVELLAHHHEQAAAGGDEEQRRTAVVTLLAAGGASLRRAAADQALAFAGRALALARGEGERLGGLELRARALHVGVRPLEALDAYLEAFAFADDQDAVRIAAHAAILCSRYGGSFKGEEWVPRAVSLNAHALALAGDAPSFELGALLLGRAAMRRAESAPAARRGAREDAGRAVEVAQAVDSPALLAYALEMLHWSETQEGFCGSGTRGRLMLGAVARMPDSVEAQDNRVVAALALAEAGEFDAARPVADDAARRAAAQSPHHRFDAMGAQAACLVPRGDIAALRTVTGNALDLAAADTSGACGAVALALGAAVLARFETRDPELAATLAAFDSAVLAGMSFSMHYRYRALELLLPVVGAAGVRERIGPTADAHPFRLALELRLAALEGDTGRVTTLAAEARARADAACAPWLAWTAAAATGSVAAAAAEFERYGAPYTAARLLADLAPDSDGLAGRFAAMGAHGSAALLT
jgi:DNA-binding SARP family transcriptional activator